ncbi:MAG TPA: CDP-alcohol phosphatidyltransferase family protein [Roseomonas sp.]|nr:CDP-alcohol phosphatidyltransferase family protein [Roseomonas sp.]
MSANTVIHLIVRPAVRRIAPSGVTPNQITSLRLVTGLAAALAFAAAPPWPAIGGVIFLLSMLLDRADGELARQTGQSSPDGHVYDLLADCTSNAIAFLGLGVGLVAALGAWGPFLGALAGLGIGTLFWQLHVLKLGEVQGWNLAPGILVDPDDLMVFVPILLWIGATVPMLFAAAIITPVLAILLGLSGRKARARQS